MYIRILKKMLSVAFVISFCLNVPLYPSCLFSLSDTSLPADKLAALLILSTPKALTQTDTQFIQQVYQSSIKGELLSKNDQARLEALALANSTYTIDITQVIASWEATIDNRFTLAQHMPLQVFVDYQKYLAAHNDLPKKTFLDIISFIKDTAKWNEHPDYNLAYFSSQYLTQLQHIVHYMGKHVLLYILPKDYSSPWWDRQDAGRCARLEAQDRNRYYPATIEQIYTRFCEQQQLFFDYQRLVPQANMSSAAREFYNFIPSYLLEETISEKGMALLTRFAQDPDAQQRIVCYELPRTYRTLNSHQCIRNGSLVPVTIAQIYAHQQNRFKLAELARDLPQEIRWKLQDIEHFLGNIANICEERLLLPDDALPYLELMAQHIGECRAAYKLRKEYVSIDYNHPLTEEYYLPITVKQLYVRQKALRYLFSVYQRLCQQSNRKPENAYYENFAELGQRTYVPHQDSSIKDTFYEFVEFIDDAIDAYRTNRLLPQSAMTRLQSLLQSIGDGICAQAEEPDTFLTIQQLYTQQLALLSRMQQGSTYAHQSEAQTNEADITAKEQPGHTKELSFSEKDYVPTPKEKMRKQEEAAKSIKGPHIKAEMIGKAA